MKAKPQPLSVPVALGVIRDGGKFLVARRPEGAHLAGAWEFPGGKLRPGEAPEEALRREVLEETGLTFRDAVLVHVEEYAYPERRVTLHCFICLGLKRSREDAGLPEMRWVTLAELKALEMPPANQRLVKVLEEQFGEDDPKVNP
jgi:8-oxo-dGTP diphosphatase